MRYSFNFLKIFLFPLLFVVKISATPPDLTGSIEGFIYDNKNNPVADAQVLIAGKKKSDISAKNGHFIITNLDAGSYSLFIEHVSFKKLQVKNIVVTSNNVTQLDTLFLTSDLYETESVVITATKSQRKISEIIPAVNSVSRIDIARRNSKTSAEALREEGGIFVQKTNHGGGSAIIRGLSSNQILILVDGIRLNNSTYRLGNHQYLTTIDNNMLEKIEVIHGPLSVLYGSDALGGTINLITRKPEFLESSLWSYAINSRFASVDKEKTTSGRIMHQSNNFVFQSGFSFKDFGNLNAGENVIYKRLQNNSNGVQKPSAYSAYDLDTKLSFMPAEQNVISLAYQLSRQKNVPRYDKYIYDNYLTWLYKPQKRDLFYLLYEIKNGFAFINSFSARMSYHLQQEGRVIQKTLTSNLENELDKVATFGFSLQFKSAYKNHLLHYGFDFYLDDVSSKAEVTKVPEKQTEKLSRGRYPDNSSYSNFGIYIEDEYFFNTNLYFLSGLRYSYFNTNFKLVENAGTNLYKKSYKALTASIGMRYDINKSSSISSSIAQGFRAPNLSDLTKFGESKGSTFEVPNLNVVPEKAISIDIGYKIALPNFQLQSSLYYISINDLLQSADDTYLGRPFIVSQQDTFKVKSKKNIGTAYISGFETSLKWTFNNFSLRKNFAYTYGQNTSINQPIGGIPPFFGLFGISWQNKSLYSELYIRYASAQDRLSDDDFDDPRIPIKGTPAWQTLNFRTEYSLSSNILVSAGIENIFDMLYREHGSGINGPGRNFIVGIRITD